MSERIATAALAETATLSEMLPRTRVDRTFGLPTGLYVATALCYLGFIAIMALATMNPELVIPLAICALFLFVAFGVNAKWVRMNPVNSSKPLGWGRFSLEGIMTNTGRVSARDASAQVLVLPLLIVFWGLAVVTLKALFL